MDEMESIPNCQECRGSGIAAHRNLRDGASICRSCNGGGIRIEAEAWRTRPDAPWLLGHRVVANHPARLFAPV